MERLKLSTLLIRRLQLTKWKIVRYALLFLGVILLIAFGIALVKMEQDLYEASKYVTAAVIVSFLAAHIIKKRFIEGQK